MSSPLRSSQRVVCRLRWHRRWARSLWRRSWWDTCTGVRLTRRASATATTASGARCTAVKLEAVGVPALARNPNHLPIYPRSISGARCSADFLKSLRYHATSAALLDCPVSSHQTLTCSSRPRPYPRPWLVHARAAFLVVAGLDVLAAVASGLLWWRTRPIYQREYLLVRYLCPCCDPDRDPDLQP